MSMEEEFQKVVPTQRSNGRTDFVHLAEQVAQAMVLSAEEQVKEAQETLERTRRDAEEMLAKVKDKDRELTSMTERIAALGQKVLEANRAFHAAASSQDQQQNENDHRP
jgi:DNA-binding ferritin-like protein